ncbi:hypothetical protein ABCR94_08915 [Streptomyces sp. 21So2-11]|uniref:hypothetical protein n=1 Tax=Streptomyces sp. 21So2-11 TaxID=3144408 RepID=UPI0032194B98
MFEYEIQKINQAELIRQADRARLARQAVDARRAARRAGRRSAKNAPEGPVYSLRSLFDRAA